MIKKLFQCRYLVLILTLISVYLIVNFTFHIRTQYIDIFNSVFLSVAASFLVGVYFQYKLKEEISDNHLKIMEFQSEYNSSGIIKYYSSFKHCEQDLRNDLLKTRNLTIYLAYGATVLNTLSEQINFILSDKKRKVEIIFIGDTNPFIEGLALQWGYNKEELLTMINKSKEVVLNLANENKNGNLLIYDNNEYPINYSFYLLDDLVYFVPSKICHPKSFTPFTIKAQKTNDEHALYGKIQEDWKKLNLKPTI